MLYLLHLFRTFFYNFAYVIIAQSFIIDIDSLNLIILLPMTNIGINSTESSQLWLV